MASDPHASRRPLAALAAAAGTGLAAYTFLLRPALLRWGATDAECREPLPGDDLVPEPMHHGTQAVTIRAPAGRVWPWLAQIGQDRGGFYSYDWLENLGGCELRSADRIVPEWQAVAVGDLVALHPCGLALPVLAAEPERLLLLGGPTVAWQADHPLGATAGSWAFVLRPVDASTTRLVCRARWNRRATPLHWLGHRAFLEAAHSVMQRKMLLGIRARAERFLDTPEGSEKTVNQGTYPAQSVSKFMAGDP